MLATVALAVVGGCRQAPTVDDLAVLADALDSPRGWQQFDQERVGRCADPVESCPRIVTVYEVPAEVDFAETATAMLMEVGLSLTGPVLASCRSEPDPGCSARSRRDEIGVRATVTDSTGDAYTVSVRVTEYVGP